VVGRETGCELDGSKGSVDVLRWCPAHMRRRASQQGGIVSVKTAATTMLRHRVLRSLWTTRTIAGAEYARAQWSAAGG
jgi:hypothetical protein